MKKHIIIASLLTATLLIGCEQEIPVLAPPPEPSGEPGSADFTMFVSLGNSLTAGYQAGALFTEGQNNSYPAIMATQFAIVSDNNEFNQPDINSVNGYNSSYSNPGGGIIRGRLILFDSDGSGPKTPSPAPAGTPGVPAPYNTADLPAPYAGDKTELNNFGVPGILLAQVLTPLTGGPSTGNPAYNGLYARFATNPGTSTILGDAIAKNPTFFSFWLGNNDVLGYATTGGSGAVGLTDPIAFEGQYATAINALLAVDADTKGIVATIPDVTTIPFFTTVKYNGIPLDEATAGALNAGFAGFNAVLSAIKENPTLMGAFGLNADDIEGRKVTYAAGTSNKILIIDEDLTDLGPTFDYLLSVDQITAEQRAALAPLEQVRQTRSTDIVCLTAGGILGTLVGGNPQLVNGLSVPLADQYILIPSEITAIKERTIAFNNIIKDVVADNNDRLALADINEKFTNVVTGVVRSVDGVPVNATFVPPFALFSEDGVHPNNRGSAYIARIFIEAINAKFGSTIPLPNISTYKSTTLPVSPI